MWRETRLATPKLDLASTLALSVRADTVGSMTRAVDLESVAHELGCRVQSFTEPSTEHSRHLASLVPRAAADQPFDIVFNNSVSDRRQRFSIAHELGHTFFFDRSSTPPRRLPSRHTEEEEKFCDLFARELLFPACNVPSEPTVDDVDMLAHRFQVAAQVVGLQCWASGRFPWRALAWLWWSPTPRDRQNWGLRVAWTITPPGVFVPTEAKYRGGPALDAYQQQRRVKGTSELRLGTLRGSFKQLARPSGSGVLLGVLNETK